VVEKAVAEDLGWRKGAFASNHDILETAKHLAIINLSGIMKISRERTEALSNILRDLCLNPTARILK